MFRGYLCASTTLTMMSPHSPSSVNLQYLFHAACFHAGLIDPRWAASELRATPVEPTEIGFLLALKRSSVKGTAAQLKHTPSSRWLCREAQSALSTSHVCIFLFFIGDPQNVALLFWCILTWEVRQELSNLCLPPLVCFLDWHKHRQQEVIL